MNERPVRGCVFGYRIHSSLEFHYLRSGEAGSPLVVEEAPSTPPSQGRELIAGSGGDGTKMPGFVDVYAVDSGYAIEADYAGWFHVEPQTPSIVVPQVEEQNWREALIWGLPTALCLIERGDLVMHAAAVEIERRALVLAAPGGHGKTTLALGFAQRGFRVLSEDLTCITLEGSPTVWPGPGVLRVRRDIASRVDTGGLTLVAEDASKLHLRVPELGSGDALPLAMVILLRVSDGGPRVETLPLERTIPDLWRLGLNIPDDRGRAHLFEKLAALAERVEVRNLYRRLDLEDLEHTIDHLVAAFPT